MYFQEVAGCSVLTLVTHLLLAINSSVNFLVYYLGRCNVQPINIQCVPNEESHQPPSLPILVNVMVVVVVLV